MPPKGNSPLPAWLPTVLAVLVLAILLFSTYRLAESVARFGFNDPDTCWLLGVGRYIVEQGALPATDPYSYMPSPLGSADGAKYVVYQWLSEVTFYLSFKYAGLVGPLLMVALVLINTFTVLPLLIAKKLKCPHILSLGLASLSSWAIFPRFFVRPEIWSNLFIVLWLILLGLLRLRSLQNQANSDVSSNSVSGNSASGNNQSGKGNNASNNNNNQSGKANNATVDWKLISAAIVLMILWCNFHCCFVVGLLLLIAHLVCVTIESVVTGSLKRSLPYTDWLLLPLAALASLINPWGIGLWTYLPKIFFAPVNHMIKELQPFALKDILHPYYYPFLTLALLCCALIIVRIFWAEKNKRLKESIGLFAPILTVAAVVEAILCKRAVAFTVGIIALQLLLTWRKVSAPGASALSEESASSSSQTSSPQSGQRSSKKQKKKSRAKPTEQEPSPPSLFAQLEKALEQKLEKFYGANYLLWLGAINIFTILVVPLYCMVYPQSMPQTRPDFRPPFKALEYISKSAPPGRIFNSTLFGDVMIWYLKGNPKIFIDTRFDLYGSQLLSDYADIFFCHPGWQDLINKYSIDWVFVPPESILANRLQEDPAWQKLYTDQDAVILVHRANH